jgi:ankyrin repeat protein
MPIVPSPDDTTHPLNIHALHSTSRLLVRKPPSVEEMDCSDIMAIMSPQTSPLHTEHAAYFLDLYEPFSWKRDIDWELLSRKASWPSHLTSCSQINPDSAVFLNPRMFETVPDAGKSVAFSMRSVAALINNMCRPQHLIVSDSHTWLEILLRPDVMQYLRALPGEIVDVLEERLFAIALRTGDLLIVNFMLALDVDAYEKIMVDWPSQSAPAYPFEVALNCGYFSVAKAIISHLSQHSTPSKLDKLLSLLLNWRESVSTENQGPEIHTSRARDSEMIELLCIVLSKGAIPESRCIAVVDGDFVLAKQLFEATGLERIDLWLQAGLVEECFERLRKHEMDEWLAEKIMRYIFKENRGRLPLGDPILETILWKVLQSAVHSQRMWAIERILVATRALDYHRDFDINLQTASGDSFFQTCRDGNWVLASLLLPTQTSTTTEMAQQQDRLHASFYKSAIQLRETNCARILGENDVCGIYELLDGTNEEDWEWVEEKCSVAINSGLDQMVVAFMQRLSITEEWQPTQRQFNSLLMHGRTAAVSALLRSDPRWQTALTTACEKNDFVALENIIFPIISCNAWFVYDEPVVQQQMSLRALAYDACERKDHNLFKWLMDCGIETDELIFNGYKDLHTSETHHYISKRPDMKGGLGGQAWQHVDTKSQVWPSLLAVAASQNDLVWMNFLFEVGVDGRDSMALLYAIQSKSSMNTIALLLEVADTRKRWDKRTYGSAALREAIKQQNPEIIEILCRSTDLDKIECSTEDTLKSEQALSPLGEAILTSNIDIVRILLQNGANPNACITYDSLKLGKHATDLLPRVSPMLSAISAQNLPMVKILAEHGAELDYKRNIGLLRTPLQRAAEIGDFDIVRYLVDQGAIVDTPPMNCGGTALQLAAMTGYVGIVSFLLKRGAKPDYPPAEGDGRTAFEAAAEWCRIDTMLLLMKWGVQLDLVVGYEHEIQYIRALRFAETNGFPASMRFVQHLYKMAGSLSMVDAQTLGLAETD